MVYETPNMSNVRHKSNKLYMLSAA